MAILLRPTAAAKRSAISVPIRNKRFANLLTECGINQAQFAKRMGVHPTTVSRWSGDAPKWAIAYLELLAKVRSLGEST